MEARKSHYLGVFSLLFTLLASGSAAAENAQLQVIDFQLRWHHQFQFAGYYAAVEKGYYRDEGFDVHLHEAAQGKMPVDEVLAGRAQYGESNSEILYARLQGKPLVVLAAIFQHSPSVFLAKKRSKIYTPHDLIGKKVMLLNSTTDAAFLAMILHEGIDLSMIKIVPSSFNFNDLLAGKVDAFNSYLTNEPYYFTKRNIDFTVINPSTYGIDFYSDILFTTTRELQEHPERVAAFRRATLKGWRYAMDHPAEIIDLLIKQYKVTKSREHLEFEADAMRRHILPDLVEIGHMNAGRWQRMADVFVEVGMGNSKNLMLDEFMYEPNSPYEIAKLKKIITAVGAFGLTGISLASIFGFGWMRLRKEIRLRKNAEKEVVRLAFNDPLTGIPNRNSFIPYANKQLLAARRTGQKLAICYIDLNRFKEINDQYGHKTGDLVLVHAATAITSVIRESDMAARFGGDEFVVLLSGIQTADDTRRTIDEIVLSIARPILIEGHQLSVKASIGVAIYPDDGEQFDGLLSKADAAMFLDKASHKAGCK